MTTKTCEKCGWVLAIQDPKLYCPICGTRFKVGICSKCGKPVEYYLHNRCVCRYCYDTVVRKPGAMQRVRQRRRDVYDEWLAKIRQIPKDYPTLTEEQWLAAVKHFNGCALCKEPVVDTRQYFIPFKYGGRYCDWNIIPVCDKCAERTGGYKKKVANYNYFLKEPQPIGLMDIVDYLGGKINEAINYCQD